MSDVRVRDPKGLVHLHRIGAKNYYVCRISVPVPPGGYRGLLRTQRPLTCLWCIAGKRFV